MRWQTDETRIKKGRNRVGQKRLPNGWTLMYNTQIFGGKQNTNLFNIERNVRDVEIWEMNGFHKGTAHRKSMIFG